MTASDWLRSLAAAGSAESQRAEFDIARHAELILIAPELAALCADAIDLIAPEAEDACDDPGCEEFSCHAAALLARFAALQPDNAKEGT